MIHYFRMVGCLILVCFLTACVTSQPLKPEVPASPVLICLPIKTYTDAQQQQVVEEIKAYGQFIPQVVNMLEDYGVMRDEDRECLSSPPVDPKTIPLPLAPQA